MAVRSRCPVVVVGEGILGRGLKSEIEVSEDYRQSGAMISAVMLDIDAPETSRQNVACPPRHASFRSAASDGPRSVDGGSTPPRLSAPTAIIARDLVSTQVIPRSFWLLMPIGFLIYTIIPFFIGLLPSYT